MEITISLFGDTASIITIGIFLAAIGTAIVIKAVTVVWGMIPFMG